jgi:SSS family solute:Na+ symporter
LLFSLIVVVPGLAAYRLLPELGHSQRFDQTLPSLMTVYYGPAMLGLGLTALLASLMSGLAANVSGFAAVWTGDIYRTRISKDRSDSHYLFVGRLAAIVAIAVSLLTSYIDFLFSTLMEHVQLIFSVFGAPFWAIFLLGMSTRRTTGRGAIAGFLSGTTVAFLYLAATSLGLIRYGSVMNANFHLAVYAFGTTCIVGWFASGLLTDRRPQAKTGLVFQWRTGLRDGGSALPWVLSAILLSVCLLLNWIWR